MFFLILFLNIFILCGHHVLAKSIQNSSSTEETLRNKIDQLETTMAALETTMTKMNTTLNKLALKESPVLFFAIIYAKDFNLQVESTVVFETVIINEGNHYNKYDGVFVAPVNGIYLFSWTVSTGGAAFVMTELVIEDRVISSTGERETDDSGTYSSASITVFSRMKKDEHAFIRTTGYGGQHYIFSDENKARTSFLGVLLYPEN